MSEWDTIHAAKFGKVGGILGNLDLYTPKS